MCQPRGFQRSFDVERERAVASLEVVDALDVAYRHFLVALTGGDVAAFLECYSSEPGVVLIGTAPDEVFVGHAEIAAVAERVMPILHRTGLTFRPGLPSIASAGEMGWVTDRTTLSAPGAAPQTLRVLATFRLEDDRWKVVAYSHSFGVPDEQVEVFRCLVTKADDRDG